MFEDFVLGKPPEFMRNAVKFLMDLDSSHFLLTASISIILLLIVSTIFMRSMKHIKHLDTEEIALGMVLATVSIFWHYTLAFLLIVFGIIYPFIIGIVLFIALGQFGNKILDRFK